MKSDTQHFFWQSYLDVFTSLFIVMLVLFVLSFKLLSDLNAETKGKLDKIREVYNSIEMLDTALFIYEPEFKRYIIKETILFAAKQSVIPLKNYAYLMRVGSNLRDMFQRLKDKYQDTLKYSLIIEGMASKDNYRYNYELSYARAKAIYDFWKSSNIKFDPEIVEVIISGSGIGGVGRHKSEKKNQRIMIQILPKLSKLINNISDQAKNPQQSPPQLIEEIPQPEANNQMTEENIYDEKQYEENTNIEDPDESSEETTSSSVEESKSNEIPIQDQAKALVTIDSVPTGAEVHIDGKVRITPCNMYLAPKTYLVTLYYAGRPPTIKSINVLSGQSHYFSFKLSE